MKVASIFLHRLVIILALIMALGLTLSPALAQTTENASISSGGNWTTTSPTPTWTCTPALSPCVPNNSSSDTFNVTIDGPSDTIAGSFVTLDNTSSPSSITVNSLSVAGPPNTVGVTLNNITVTLDVTGGASLTVGGTFTDGGRETRIGAGSKITANGFGNLSSSTLSSGPYYVGGTFQYGGSGANTITAIANGAAVALDGSDGGAAFITPDGTTNALSTLTVNNGLLELANGVSLGIASLSGPSGIVTLNNTAGGSSALSVGGNYDQAGTYLLGSGNTLTVSGTITNDSGQWEVFGGSAITAHGFGNLSGGRLSSGFYYIGGTFQYGGSSSNTITAIAGGTVVQLGGENGGAALMTPDGTTNALSTITTNNGELELMNGASVDATNTLASVTGSTGSLYLLNEAGVPGARGSVLNVAGNYDQQNTVLFGSGNTLTVGGTLTNDGGILEVDAGSTIKANSFSNLSGGTLSGSTGVGSNSQYLIGGTFQYGGSSSNAITTIANGVSVTLDGENGGAALMTPDSATNALSTLTTNNGYLVLEDGASVGATLASLTGSTGSLQLYDSGGPPFVGSTLNVTGNYDQYNTSVTGPGNALTVGGTFTSDGGTVEIETGSMITVTAQYSQSSGTTDVNGTLMSPTVNINGGTLSGTGTVKGAVTIASGATLSPGDPGTFDITGSLDLGGTLNEVIDSSSSFDVTSATGELTLGSSSVLDIILAPGYDPGTGTSFAIMDFGSLTPGSTFGSILNQTFNGGTEQWDVTYNPTDIVLTAGTVSSTTPEPASFVLLGTGLLFLLGYSLRRRACAAR